MEKCLVFLQFLYYFAMLSALSQNNPIYYCIIRNKMIRKNMFFMKATLKAGFILSSITVMINFLK